MSEFQTIVQFILVGKGAQSNQRHANCDFDHIQGMTNSNFTLIYVQIMPLNMPPYY